MNNLEQRAANLRAALPEDMQAVLIQRPENMFYLLDFDAHDAGTLLMLPDGLHYIIDSRYIENAKRQIKNASVILQEDTYKQVAALLDGAGVAALCCEDKITVAGLNALKEKLPGVEVAASAALTKALEGLRAVKDAEEVRRMKEAQRITDNCFTHILGFLKEGVREIDMMLEMEHYMRANGAEQVAFGTIFIAGANTSLPHGVPGENRLKPGDFITMDFGAKHRGYCADMTRTVCLGEASAEQKKVHETVLRAHRTAMAALKAGVVGRDVDKIARDMIDEAGYQGCFGHGLGHSVGIEIHEEPRLSPLFTGTIPAGCMISVEPGIYLEGRFGCRIEDTVLVTETGVDDFPTSNKELIVL